MEINVTFIVNAKCKVYGEDGESCTIEDVELEFDADSAEKFLYRFYDPVIQVSDYKLLFKYNNNFKVEGIVLYKDRYTYIVMDPNNMINEIQKGYYQLRSLYTISDIMSFDFEAATCLKNDSIED